MKSMSTGILSPCDLPARPGNSSEGDGNYKGDQARLCSACGCAQQQWGVFPPGGVSPPCHGHRETHTCGSGGHPGRRQDGASRWQRGVSCGNFARSGFPGGESARGGRAFTHANATHGLFYDSAQLLNGTKFGLAFYCGFNLGSGSAGGRGGVLAPGLCPALPVLRLFPQGPDATASARSVGTAAQTAG